MSLRVLVVGIAAWSLAAIWSARADEVRDRVQQGNQHYAAGRYAEALKSYQEAATGQARLSPELMHDLAAVYFKLGQREEARDWWVRLKEAGDAALEARARYNLGNCDYADALDAAQQGPPLALQQLAAATAQYRAALQLDPGLADARANLELAERLKRQIEEQTKNQSQSQPTKGDQQQGKPSSSSQPSSQPQSQPSQAGEQGQQDQSATSQAAESQPAQPPEQGQPKEQEEQESRPQAGEEEPQPSPESQPQTMPATTQPAEPQEGQPTTVLHLTREQAERLLQMVRDAEKARREKLAQQRAATQKKVERDW
jgi:Ca-activated chloride channel family protein